MILAMAATCATGPSLAQRSPAVVQTAEAETDRMDAHEVISRMIERNPLLYSYRARVHVTLRMLNVPFLAPHLDGTTYFKRPDNYEFASTSLGSIIAA
jgi:hypothetical protein